MSIKVKLSNKSDFKKVLLSKVSSVYVYVDEKGNEIRRHYTKLNPELFAEEVKRYGTHRKEYYLYV